MYGQFSVLEQAMSVTFKNEETCYELKIIFGEGLKLIVKNTLIKQER